MDHFVLISSFSCKDCAPRLTLTTAQVGSPTGLNQELSNTNLNKLKLIEMLHLFYVSEFWECKIYSTELQKRRPWTINCWNFLIWVVDWATSMLHLMLDFAFDCVYILHAFTYFHITCMGYFSFWNSWKAWFCSAVESSQSTCRVCI